jgi:hypothetical protein
MLTTTGNKPATIQLGELVDAPVWCSPERVVIDDVVRAPAGLHVSTAKALELGIIDQATADAYHEAVAALVAVVTAGTKSRLVVKRDTLGYNVE